MKSIQFIKYRTITVVFIILFFQVNAQFKTNSNWENMLSKYDLVWTKMPLNYYEGPYVGNGLLGTVFFKDTILPNTICFEIGRTDAYDHRTAEQIKNKYPWPKVRLPIGKLLLSTKQKIDSVYFRTSLWNAEVNGTIYTADGKISVRCYVPSNQKIIVVEYNDALAKQQVNVQFRPEQGNNARAERRPMQGKLYEPNPPFIVSRKNDIEVIQQPLLNGDDYATAWNKIQHNNGTHSIYVTVANNWAEGIQPFSASNLQAEEQLKAARKISEQTIQQQHRDWWHQFYPASFVSIPDARIQSFYWVQMYRLASAGRKDLPVIDLLGPWYKPSVWLSIWANLNIQLTYYTTGITNHLDLEEAYFNMIEKYQQQLINNVPKNFQNDCAAIQTVVMFNDLSGNVFLTTDTASKQKMSLIALPWIMQQFYTNYRYTMNDEQLKTVIYPLMKRAFQVYVRVLYKSSDGKYHLPLTFSDEYGEDVDVSMNLALAKWGFKTLIACAERLKMQDTMLPIWKDRLQYMVDYATDERGIKIGKNLSFNKPHRHYSHLFSIFPLYETNIDNSNTNIELLEKSIKNYTGLNGDNCMYKFNGAASLWAALGKGNDALYWLKRSLEVLPYSVPTVTANGFYSENGWPTFESPIASTRSMLDMLLQTWGNKIRIFPAMPDEWKDASFHQLRAEGGFMVSAKRINGKTNCVSITSNAGEPCIVEVKDWTGNIFSSDKKIKIEKIKEGVYKVLLKKNQSAVLYQKLENTNFQIEPSNQNEFHWGLN